LPEPKKILDLPPRLFVIGDIHGCLDEAAAVVEFLRDQEDLSQEDLLVFVGDYIDRGGSSKEVVEYLLSIQQDFPRTIFLKGNHEDMLLAFMGFEGHMGSSYLMNGGLQTLQSYGFYAEVVPERCLAEMPEPHIRFFQSLERCLMVQNLVIVHAGLNPLVDVDYQQDEDLFWIRDEFIANVHFFEKTVVFGHTPYRDVMFDLPYKIGIDTGLVYGNKLTCVELINGEVFQISRGSRRVQVFTFEQKGGQKLLLKPAQPENEE
jgi:serine/threonine protein phosphatase 1